MSGNHESGEFSPQFQMLCLTAIQCNPWTRYPQGHVVFIVDVTCSYSDVGPTLKPILELDYAEFPSSFIAVMGNKLYVFGGGDLDPSKCKFVTDDGLEFYGAYWSSEVYVYDLKKAIISSSCASETPMLHKRDADEILNMKGRKFGPYAAKIDDYRFCVFSSDLLRTRNPSLFRSCVFPEPRCTPPNFELFDTRDRSWTPLPDVYDFYPRRLMDSDFELCISIYAVKHSNLIVYTTRGDLYHMDFKFSRPPWVQLSAFQIPKSYPHHFTQYPVSSVMIGDRILCTPFEFMELGKSRRNYHPIPLKDVAGEALYHPSGGLCSEGQYVYIARCGERGDSGKHFFWLDILNFHKRSKRPKIANLKSVCFSLDAMCIRFGVFPIKDQGIYSLWKQDDLEQCSEEPKLDGCD